MSYMMDFEAPENVKSSDSVMDYDGQFKLVCDPKSLLYLFGMQLDYSDALIGGGFQFHNPNATDSCGCGKSFGV
jgi:iron-sulfur cluster assembly protein